MNRHLILTHGRSGSNYLANTLNLHPEIVNYGEVLGQWTLPYKLYMSTRYLGWTWADFIEWMYGSYSSFYAAQFTSSLSHLRKKKAVNFKKRSSIKNIGFKDFAFLFKNRGLLDYLNSHDDIQVIYLRRKNLFDRYFSLLNMGATGIVSVEKQSVDIKKINVDTDDMLKNILAFKAEEEIADNLLSSIHEERVFHLSYDDYFSSAEKTSQYNNEIFDFLGVNAINTQSRQRKIITNPVSELVENYAQVEHVLCRAGFDEFLSKEN